MKREGRSRKPLKKLESEKKGEGANASSDPAVTRRGPQERSAKARAAWRGGGEKLQAPLTSLSLGGRERDGERQGRGA